MNFKKFLMIPVFAALPLVTGCGDDCKSFCNDRNDCAGATKVDCDKYCDNAEQVAKDAGCSDQYDDLASCGAGMDDVCKASDTSCAGEYSKLQACAGAYCMKAENQAKCLEAGIVVGVDFN